MTLKLKASSLFDDEDMENMNAEFANIFQRFDEKAQFKQEQASKDVGMVDSEESDAENKDTKSG